MHAYNGRRHFRAQSGRERNSACDFDGNDVDARHFAQRCTTASKGANTGAVTATGILHGHLVGGKDRGVRAGPAMASHNDVRAIGERGQGIEPRIAQSWISTFGSWSVRGGCKETA